jgi:hypothetical protein
VRKSSTGPTLESTATLKPPTDPWESLDNTLRHLPEVGPAARLRSRQHLYSLFVSASILGCGSVETKAIDFFDEIQMRYREVGGLYFAPSSVTGG